MGTETKATHTPGPWMYDDDCIGVSDTPWDKEPFITSRICNMVGDHVSCDETEANGQLIAAAPDMKLGINLALDILREVAWGEKDWAKNHKHAVETAIVSLEKGQTKAEGK